MSHDSIDSIAIGRFDGLHLGHRVLIESLGSCGALVVIDAGTHDLTPIRHIERLTRIPVVRFDLGMIRHLFACDFMILLSEMFPSLRRIVVGEDFRFGCERSGDIETLRTWFSGEVVCIAEVQLDGEPVRSSRIRHHLARGNIVRANALLGRDYSIFWSVGPDGILQNTPYMLPLCGQYEGWTENKQQSCRIDVLDTRTMRINPVYDDGDLIEREIWFIGALS